MNKSLFWDLEIVWRDRWPTLEELISDEPFDIWRYWPFDVSVAAEVRSDAACQTWCQPNKVWSVGDVSDFICYLLDCLAKDYRIFTWNGTGFDYRVLAQLCNNKHVHEDIVTLAQKSYDPAFQILCWKGYPVGMQACAEGFGFEGKLEDGADAPTLWAAGEYQRVIDYVKQDVVVLQNVVLEMVKQRGLRWRNKNKESRFQPLHKILRAEQCLQLPQPDTNWMESSIQREDVVGWWYK